MEYPKNQIEFEKSFATESQCIDYLLKLRIENVFKCPLCFHLEYWVSNRSQLVCKSCNRQTSITAGTIFHSTKTPITVLFRALWFIVAQKNGVRYNRRNSKSRGLLFYTLLKQAMSHQPLSKKNLFETQ